MSGAAIPVDRKQPEGTPLGVFPVVGAAADVAAFCLATGSAADGDTLPLTFPMRWLVAAEVRAALLALVPDRDVVLVHESQTFEQARPLHVGEAYRLALTCRREPAPDRLFVDGLITDQAGVARGALATTLRLIAAPAA